MALLNATRSGAVDGVFADHGVGANPKVEPGYARMCNGRGSGRSCYNFSLAFAAAFTAGHERLLNHSQDVLARETGGPVICGHYATWGVPTEFEGLRARVAAGEAGTGPFILEASHDHGRSTGCDVAADEARLAGYLCAMGKYTYLSCFATQRGGEPLPAFYDAYTKPLGVPQSAAVETSPGNWSRIFRSDVGDTIAWYHPLTGRGAVRWAAG